MSNKDLTKKLPLLEAMSAGEIKVPTNIPIPVYLREAHKLVALGANDLAALKSCGFREEFLEEMKVRIGALKEAHSQWMMLRYDRQGARQRWDEQAERGKSVHSELLAALRFVLRGSEKGKLLKSFSKNVTNYNLISELKELALLAEGNSEALEAIRLDRGLIEEAFQLAGRLEELQEEVERALERPKELKRVRDAAYSHLREGVGLLRDYAGYVFRDDKVKREQYASDYLRAKRKRLAKRRTEEVVTAPSAVASVENAEGAEKRGKRKMKGGEVVSDRNGQVPVVRNTGKEKIVTTRSVEASLEGHPLALEGTGGKREEEKRERKSEEVVFVAAGTGKDVVSRALEGEMSEERKAKRVVEADSGGSGCGSREVKREKVFSLAEGSRSGPAFRSAGAGVKESGQVEERSGQVKSGAGSRLERYETPLGEYKGRLE